ncbi:uncharacterized protein LOC118508556 isoform X2 [Anopheles stephensi]|uniref:uncharacterized protein LOC118508556 isoform X2 n=1 Tax=Anopheles stephensi TaxID=30069 RepID=UPI001658B804|nr:uncharacterized protein LOC118508556 isoform X2 [Anopheles stephensi]
MKTGYGLNTADSLGYLGYGSKPYSSLTYLGSKGYSSSSAGLRSKSALDKDVIMSKVKKPKLRKTSTEKIETPLYKKKTFDFTDYAYREAVNRLKFLLTEAYEPTKAATSFYYRSVDDGKSEVSDSQSVVERPSITEVSKYFPSTAVTRYGSTLGRRYSFLHKDTAAGPLKPALSNSSLHPAPSSGHATQSLEVAQPPPELLGFIEKQESYIEQLERESQYCREELSTLLKKVKEVVSENEALTDRSRSKALYQLDSSESEDVDYGDRGKGKGALSGPSIVFESRISELEAQLAQSQIDLKKLFNENEENKRKLLHGASDVGNADAYRKQVDNLQRDKQNLEETVRKLQLSIDQLKDTEACNFSKSQRSRDMIEQVAFERNQAEIEIRRLKDELERQHERVREVQHEMAKRIADERAIAERRYTYHVDQLGGDLSSQWEHATKLQLEVERMKRIESDYKRELNQKSSQIDELKMELKNKSAIFMSDLNQASAEKQSLEQEITSLRLQLERAERQSKVEVSRLNAEITSLRQRLDRADADLLHSKRENLKLADDVASLEKELTLGELNRETRPSKELAKIISDMEAKHTNTVSELEGMIQDQKQLMEKLTAECKSLTHKLEDTTQKHKQEIDYLQENLEFLSKHINTTNPSATASNDTNQYASTNPALDDNRYSNDLQATLYNQADSYPGGVAGSSVVPDASAAAAYSSPSPNQSIVRDDVNNYEAVNSGSRPGSTAARYAPPASNGRTVPPVSDTFDDGTTGVGTGRQYGGAGGGKSSRPESRTSDRQQYAQPKQPPELSRNNSVADYVEPKRSESRLSRSSVTNDEGVRGSGGVPKESEYGRTVEPERLSRTSDSTKPDSAGGGAASGSSGRLSRESVADQRASRQSMQSLAGSQQYGTADAVDPATAQYTAQQQQQQQQQQYGEFAYPTGDQQQYSALDDQSAAGYDSTQQQYTDQQQYEGYAEQYDQQQQQVYDQQQYQGYQQSYDAQQYAPEQVYDESSYATGTGTLQQPVAPAPAPAAPAPPVVAQSPTQVSAPSAVPSASSAATPVPAAAPAPSTTGTGKQQSGKSAVAVEQKEGNRAVGNTRSGASSRAGANGQRYKQPSGAGR